MGFFAWGCCDVQEEKQRLVVCELCVDEFCVGGGQVEGADCVRVEVAGERGEGWGVREAVDLEVRC